MKVSKTYAVLLSVWCILLGPKMNSDASEKFDPPRLPGATLLIGSASPFFLVATTPNGTQRILPEPNQPESRDYTPVYPSISRDGSLVATVRLKTGGYPRQVAIATYSIPEKKWTEYAEGEFAGAVAVTPDGSKLAFSASRQRVGGSGDDHLHIIDLRTGRESIGPQVPSFSQVFVSWSPDSRRLAYSFNFEIRVWDTDTSKTSKIADGALPAWSPSGEWIAYLQGASDDRSGTRCMEVHPDGSGEIALVQPHKERGFVEPPVWSPDSNAILLNELVNFDKATVDVHMLDLKTHRLKTVFKDNLPVVGWAEAR
jgi:Tol biopolymer transport system component